MPPYVFESLQYFVNQAKNKGLEVIDCGMGNPDSAPPKHAMEKILELSASGKYYGYSTVGGIVELRKAIAEYYARRFKVEIDYKTEALVTIGSKEGIVSLAHAMCSKGDIIVSPNPCYPIHTFAFTLVGATVVRVDAIKAADFLAKFKKLVESSAKKPFAVIVNYPCNPTTETVDLDFYAELVSFCKKHEIYIISDIAYAEIYFDPNNKPPSILEVKGAKDIAIEFSTISKSFSMAGARIGFAVGNAKLVEALYKIKSYLDYGSFAPLQYAACEALSAKSDQYLADLRKLYAGRAKYLTKALITKLGVKQREPKGSMFLWMKLPEQFAHLSSFEFCKKLIEQTGVVLSPGSSFGSNGNSYVRISMLYDEANIDKAVARVANFKE